MDPQDLPPPLAPGDPEGDLAVEPAGPPERRVHHVRHVGGPDDHDFPAFHQAVHEGQELGDDPFLDVSHHHGALGRQGVDLVQKDDAGGVPPGLFEDLTQLGFAFPVELVDDLGPVDMDEVGPHLVGDGPSDERLARAGWSGEQDAARWIDAEHSEELGELQGKLDHLSDQRHLPVEAADVLVGDPVRLLRRHLGRPERDRGVAGDEDRPARIRAIDRE